MVCKFCGAPSAEGAMVCSACLGKLSGELVLREWSADREYFTTVLMHKAGADTPTDGSAPASDPEEEHA